MNKIRLIELFAGVGSQAMGLRDIGADFEHYRVVEVDKYAVASYNAIHSTDFPTMDITKINGKDLGIVDKLNYTYLLTYSFPCTDLSVAGKMMGMVEGSGTRSSLLWEVKRLLDECGDELPQILVMENVTQVHSASNMPHFQKWLNYLESKGYSNYWQDLNAKNYGVAQSRNRCFVVSVLGNYTYTFPNPSPLTKVIKDYIEPEVDAKYYLKSEKAKELIDKLIKGGKLSDEIVKVKQATKEGYIPCGTVIYDDYNSKIRKDQETLGTITTNIGNDALRNGQKIVEIYPILTTENTPSALEPWIWEIDEVPYLIRIRKLTPKECWRLMGFTDEDFEKAAAVNSNTQLYKQAGNSIVKNVLCEIFSQIT